MSNQHRPTDSDLVGGFSVGWDQYDDTRIRFTLYGYQVNEAQPDADPIRIELARAKITTGWGLAANAQALMGQALGLPQHECPHCHVIIEAQPGPIDNIIADEKRLIALRAGNPRDRKLLVGDEVVRSLRSLPGGKIH